MTPVPIISSARGLPCRAATCDAVFHPVGRTYADLFAAVELRDAHELAAHQYTHRVFTPRQTPYNQRLRP